MYRLAYGSQGSRCALVVSEPITSQCTDWVSVPRNTALVVVKDKAGFITIIRSPLNPTPDSARVEVSRQANSCMGHSEVLSPRQSKSDKVGGGDISAEVTGSIHTGQHESAHEREAKLSVPAPAYGWM